MLQIQSKRLPVFPAQRESIALPKHYRTLIQLIFTQNINKFIDRLTFPKALLQAFIPSLQVFLNVDWCNSFLKIKKNIDFSILMHLSILHQNVVFNPSGIV